jgi:glycosyltransferase involved in cell wall biosynthesis
VRVLVVSGYPPIPLDNGGRIRTFHLVEELARRFRVWLVCFDHEPGSGAEPQSETAIAAALPGVERVVTVPPPGGPKRAKQLAALASGRSYGLLLHRSGELARAVERAAGKLQPELAHCDTLFCAFVRDQVATPSSWVLHMHNSESLLKRRLADTAGNPARRLLYRSEARALERLERRYLTELEHCVAVSELEAERFRASSSSVVTVPNGVDARPEPPPPAGPREGEPLRLVFVGSQNYEPNRLGLEWFVESVAPLLRERVEIAIDVVGPGRRGRPLDGVDYLGRVEELGPIYARAHAALVPLRAGAGSRLKVVEALAHGVPLLSTAIGAEGFELVDGEHALIADAPEALAERVERLDASLRGDAQLAVRLKDAGYRFATGFFWPRLGEGLRDVYARWGAERPSRD